MILPGRDLARGCSQTLVQIRIAWRAYKETKDQLTEGGQGLRLFLACSSGDSDTPESLRTVLLRGCSTLAEHWVTWPVVKRTQMPASTLRDWFPLVWVRPEPQEFKSPPPSNSDVQPSVKATLWRMKSRFINIFRSRWREQSLTSFGNR